MGRQVRAACLRIGQQAGLSLVQRLAKGGAANGAEGVIGGVAIVAVDGAQVAGPQLRAQPARQHRHACATLQSSQLRQIKQCSDKTQMYVWRSLSRGTKSATVY